VPTIFICYRRDDSAGYAGHLYERIAKEFGKTHVFIDVDDIPPGEDFVKIIERRVLSCDVLIAIIGRTWLTITDKAGARRLDDPDDFVHLEISTALRNNIKVIPVLVANARMPRPEELPTPLAQLARFNAAEISDRFFGTTTNDLIVALRASVTTGGNALQERLCHPSASAILVTPDAKEIYYVDENNGKIVVVENLPQAASGLKTKAVIDVNRSGSAAHPERLALNPITNRLYVTDSRSDEVIVIDRSHDNDVETRIPVGRIPRSIVFTANGEKAYVSNEGPIPQGALV